MRALVLYPHEGYNCINNLIIYAYLSSQNELKRTSKMNCQTIHFDQNLELCLMTDAILKKLLKITLERFDNCAKSGIDFQVKTLRKTELLRRVKKKVTEITYNHRKTERTVPGSEVRHNNRLYNE